MRADIGARGHGRDAMNATELADLIAKGHWVFTDDDEATIVAALRQYAAEKTHGERIASILGWDKCETEADWITALAKISEEHDQYAAMEWLTNQPDSWMQTTTSGGMRVGAKTTERGVDGPTITEAINNLRAKLEPPHEHVWEVTDSGEAHCGCCEVLPVAEVNRRLNAVTP